MPESDDLHEAGAVSSEEVGGWHTLVLIEKASGSQYDALLEAVRQIGRVPAPVAALALSGRGFHGNRGRPWQAVAGNLHLSAAIPVQLPAARCAPAVAAIPALATCEAIVRVAPDARPTLKWVNDVLLGRAKVAGVISATQSRGRDLVSLIYGIGLNVATTPEVAPTVFVPEVTSLAGAGHAVDLGQVTARVLERLWWHVDHLQAAGPDLAIERYRRWCGDVGREVAVYAEGLVDSDDPAALPEPVALGRVEALDTQLALRVAGHPEPLSGGRLRHLD